MRQKDSLMSSASAEWYTPECVLERVRQVAPIGLDPCSSGRDLVGARRHWLSSQDGLSQVWECAPNELIYVNPPYGRGIGSWVEKCERVAESGTSVITLLPARVDTKWWQTCWCAYMICFWRGRLKFSGHENSAPFPSALVLFTEDPDVSARFCRAFRDVGHLVKP